MNESYEKAKADSLQSYGKEKNNSDFYPTRNRQQTQREASIMDRKNIIASLDVLSQNFEENDPINESLRAMAYTVSKMADEEFESRTAKKKVKMVKCPKCGNPKVMAQTGYCLKCGTKGIGKDKKKDEKDEKKKAKKASEYFWSKAASDAIALALVQDVCGTSDDDAKEEIPEEKEAMKKEDDKECPPEKESMKKEDDKECPPEKEAKKDEDEDDDATASKKEDDEDDDATAAKKVEDEEEKDAAKKDEKEEEDKEAGKAPEEMKKDDEEVEAKKKVVNTDMLANIEGVEMNIGMLSLDDVGELTATEKEELDKLFQ